MGFEEQFFEIQPHGKVLVLRLPEVKSRFGQTALLDQLRRFFYQPKGESEFSQTALFDQLERYSYRPKPYVGIVIDVGHSTYTFSSRDLGALIFALPGRGTGHLGPCVVVICGKQAQRLQAILKITQLSSFIQITDSNEQAIAQIRERLKDRGRGYPSLMVGSSRADELSPTNNEASKVEPYRNIAEKPLPANENSTSKQTQIFLAHASEDKDAVRRLYSQLKSSGFRPWLDEIDLMPGQNWPVEIPKAIGRSDIFIACLSTHSVQKQGYVQKEFRLALNAYAEKPPGSIYLIPAKLDDCEIPDLQVPQLGISLRDIQWIELWKKDGFERLVKAIGHGPDTRKYESSAPESETANATVRIVDITFTESRPDEDDPRASRMMKIPPWIREWGNYVQIDLKLRNVSTEVAFLKRVIVHVDQLWALEDFGFTGAAIPPSAEYDVELPIQEPPFSLKHSISQSIEPNGVDRFLITLHPEKPDHLFVTHLEIIYDEDDKSVMSGKIIFATRCGGTFPTASEQMLLDMDQAVEENHPHLKTRWKSARERINRNNRIRETIIKIGGVKNKIALSFEQGEPIVEGF
jgi:TIR domain